LIIVDVSASNEAFVGSVCLIAVRHSVSGRTGCLRCGRVDKTPRLCSSTCLAPSRYVSPPWSICPLCCFLVFELFLTHCCIVVDWWVCPWQVLGSTTTMVDGGQTLLGVLTALHDAGGPSMDGEVLLTARRTTHNDSGVTPDHVWTYSVQPVSVRRPTDDVNHTLYLPGGACTLIYLGVSWQVRLNESRISRSVSVWWTAVIFRIQT